MTEEAKEEEGGEVEGESETEGDGEVKCLLIHTRKFSVTFQQQQKHILTYTFLFSW